MIENVQQEVEWARAARNIIETAREMAEARHVTLRETKWHRGHEVADLDGWWLTLMTENRAITERFPNEWLETRGAGGIDPRVTRLLSRMMQALALHAEPLARHAPTS
jgi:hypothetical protein